MVCPKGVDPALGIQLLRGHLLGFSKNEKKWLNPEIETWAKYENRLAHHVYILALSL